MLGMPVIAVVLGARLMPVANPVVCTTDRSAFCKRKSLAVWGVCGSTETRYARIITCHVTYLCRQALCRYNCAGDAQFAWCKQCVMLLLSGSRQTACGTAHAEACVVCRVHPSPDIPRGEERGILGC